MGLKSFMEHLKNRATVPSVPSEKSAEGTREPAWIKAVPPVPSVPLHLNDTRANTQIGPFGEAVNDPASEPPADPNDWRELSQAYHRAPRQVQHLHCRRAWGHIRPALWKTYQATS